MNSLEGAMLVARPYDDVERFKASASQIIASLLAPRPSRARSTK
jgi:hypothetical protein